MSLPIFQRTIVDSSGNIQSGASVAVRNETTGELVPIFADREGGTAKANPFLADSEGFATFYVEPGEYQITATTTAGTITWSHVAIGDTALLQLAQPTGDTLVGSDDGASGSLWTTVAGFLTHLKSTAGAAIAGFSWAALPAAVNKVDWGIRTAGPGLNVLRYIPPAEWPAIFAGTSAYDATADVTAAAAAAVAEGKQLDVPAGQFILNDFAVPPGLAMVGHGSQNSTSDSRPTTRIKCTTGAYAMQTEYSPAIRGYRLENLTVVGHAGAQYGIVAQGTSGFLKNITVLDVTNGVGIRYSRAWRGSVEDIQVYRCGLGMLLGFTDSAVNGTHFRSVTIELCRVGMYSFDLTTAPQIGNNFDNLLIEACGSSYHSGDWPSFLTLSADFKADTGMAEATVQGALILERNFYAQFSALYLEVNTGIYIWQGSTGMMLVESGIVEMTEPANTYTGRPMILRRSPFAMRHVRLTWDDGKTTELFGIASGHRQETEHLIFNTVGTTRGLYYDYTLGTANVRPSNSRLHMRDGTLLEPRVRNSSVEVVTPSIAGANIRLNCAAGSVFVLNGITQNTAIDADFPTNGVEITLVVKQDATGGRTVSFSSAFVHSWVNTGNTAGKTSAITFVYSTALNKFVQSAAQTPYA